MKILEVLEAVEGGTRKHIEHILTGLKSDFEFYFAYSLHRNKSYINDIKRYESLGISCIEIPMVRNISLDSDKRAVQALQEVMKKCDPEIIHAHSSKAGYISRKAAQKTGAKIVYTPHCLYFPSQKGLRRLMYKWGEKMHERYTDTYIAVSDSEKDDLVKYITTQEKVVRINNGVDLPDISSKNKGEKRVLFPARAVRQKGWEFFLDTAEMVLEKDKEIVFVFAGSGEKFRKINARVAKLGLEKSVLLPGYVEKIEEEYLTANVVAVTSRWEGQPYSILEAMSYACPVVAFDIPGVNELVQHGVNGYLVPRFNCRIFAERILSVIHDPLLGHTMGNNGRKKVESDFTKSRFLDCMRGLYNSFAVADKSR